MPNSEVRRVVLNQDGTINLVVDVHGFDPGTPVEISGHVLQGNGTVAPFYSVQEMPEDGRLLVAGLSAVTPNNFAAGLPMTVLARVAQVWVTTLDYDTGSGAIPQAASSDPSQASWEADDRNWALSRPGFDVAARDWEEGDTVL